MKAFLACRLERRWTIVNQDTFVSLATNKKKYTHTRAHMKEEERKKEQETEIK